MEANGTARGAPLVLVVDDTPSLLDLVRECLEPEGYRVVTCLQSRDAMRLAHETRPSVVMLDLVMPEIDGWQILAALGSSPSLAETPVIICTAYVAEALGRLTELQGPAGGRPVGLLPKPFDIEELIDVVNSITGRDQAGVVPSAPRGGEGSR